MNAIPEVMWFGNIDGQWPVYCWESDAQAMAWLAKGGTEERRRLWKARVVDPVEFERVSPKSYLQQKTSVAGAS